MEELDIWLQAEVRVQARRPVVPKERRRLTVYQLNLHIQEIAIQLRKALIPKEMARKALNLVHDEPIYGLIYLYDHIKHQIQA